MSDPIEKLCGGIHEGIQEETRALLHSTFRSGSWKIWTVGLAGFFVGGFLLSITDPFARGAIGVGVLLFLMQVSRMISRWIIGKGGLVALMFSKDKLNYAKNQLLMMGPERSKEVIEKIGGVGL